MTKILIDADLGNKLQHPAHAVELCDESGRVFGRFLPALDSSLCEGLQSPISKEELQRRKLNKGTGKTYNTAEVLEYLEKLC
jgi:hypothetical protein